ALTVDGAGIIVILRNMTIDSSNPSTPGAIGINVVQAASLHVEYCTIRGFTGPAIKFAPSAPGSQLAVSDTVITDNGSGAAGGGIQIAPAAGGVGVVLNRVTFGFNVTAMVLYSGNGSIGAVMRDSVVSASKSNGILAIAGQPLNLAIERSSLVNN